MPSILYVLNPAGQQGGGISLVSGDNSETEGESEENSTSPDSTIVIPQDSSMGSIGVGPQQAFNIKQITCLFWLQKGPMLLFSGPKRAIWEEKRKEAESHNALFDAKKGDIGPENAYNWTDFTNFSIS